MNKSFTLIELLIVIAIIAILAVGIIILIIPGERLAQARDATRASHLHALETALYLYVVDNGEYPPGISNEELIEICNTGVESPTCGTLLDLSDLNITIPVDPLGGIDPNGTGYFVALKNDKLVSQAPKSEEDIIATGSVVGMEGHGGIIAYVGTASPPYILIVAEEDQSEAQAWSNITNDLAGTTGTALGTGKSNTAAIMAQTGHTASAAKICDELEHNGYTDWFLPSKDELNHIYCNLHKGSGASPFFGDCSGTDDLQLEIGSFAASLYWSSSEDSSYGAWEQYFGDGSQINDFKFGPFRVRCARAI